MQTDMKWKKRWQKRWQHAVDRFNSCVKSDKLKRRGGFGLNEVIGIAAGIIIALVVIIPGLQAFASDIVAQLSDWWTSLSADIFPQG